MTSTESPAVARRRLRLTLRNLRDERHLTQAHVAEALDWSLSKVIRIEKGDVTISRNDLRALLSHYQVRDPELIERLVEEARASRVRGWWTEAHLREHLTPALVELLQFESEATAFRCFQPALVPGIFQTEEYAAAIMNAWSREHSAETRAARLEVRAARYSHIFDRPDPASYFLVLDESVVYRQIGGAAIASAQLRHLLDLARLGRVSVRINPFERPGAAASLGSFILIDLDEGAVLYRESHHQDQIEQTADEVTRHRHIFEELWQNALSEDATARLIEARVTYMLASLDRPSG